MGAKMRHFYVHSIFEVEFVSENLLGTLSLKIWTVTVAFLTTSKPIYSKSEQAVSAKITHMLVGEHMTNGFSQVPNFSAAGGQSCKKMENSTPITLNWK